MKKNQTASQFAKRASQKAARKRFGRNIRILFATLFAAFFAFLFLAPIVLTITNSFMSAGEIAANYGTIFATTETGGKVYIAEKVNLKFIPDMVSASQYITVLFKSPDYLFKFWNSVVLVGPIVIFQLITAALASYGFARYEGKLRQIIFFLYIINVKVANNISLSHLFNTLIAKDVRVP